MDSTQDSPNPTPCSAANTRCAALRLIAVTLCLLLLGLIALFLIPARTEPPIVWLTPAQVERNQHPGALGKVVRSAQNWFARVRERLYRNQRVGSIQVQLRICSISPQADLSSLLGPPVSTNVDGQQAWLLSPADYATLKPNLRRTNGLTALGSPTAIIDDGRQAQMMIGNSIPTGPTNPLPPGPRGPSPAPSVFAGITIGVTPKSIPGVERLVRLPVTACSTEVVSATTSNVVLKTNFFIASRARVHSGGALVITCPNADAANPTNYLIIVAPGYVDSSGGPLAIPGAPALRPSGAP
jgi:hypothetical protein